MSLLPEGTSGHALADSRVDEGDPLPGSSTSQPLALFGRGKPESAQRSAQHGAVDKPGSVCPLSSDEGILPEVQLGDDSSARVPKHIPGAGVSSIRIWASWSNWHQDLFASSTPFSRFYKAQCSRWLAANSQAVREEDQVWPMPLPYRRFAGKGICDRERGFRRLLNLQVSYLNFLHLGGRSPPSGICGPTPLSSKQKEVVARLRRLSEAWSLLDELHAADMGRTAAKQEKQEQVLGCLTKMCTAAVGDLKKYRLQRSCVTQGHEKDDLGQVIGKMNFGDSVAAQPIVASRVKMDGRPCFDPTPFLDEESHKLFVEPFHQDLHQERDRLHPPRVQIHASTTEKVKLLHLLNRSGRLVFRKVSDAFRGFGNGLFCVSKNLEVDRLILDGRPANLLQVPPDHYILTMASTSALLGVHLKPHEKLLFSGDDLSNFFYMFKVGPQRASRNFLDWAIPTKLVRDFAGFPQDLLGEEFVYACLNSLAMGDSAACAYAQTSHLAMALQCNALDGDSLLTMHGRAPRGSFMGGIIIDDFVIMQKVSWDAQVGDQLLRRRSNMHAMYKRADLQAHPTKGFDNVDCADFWGANVNGVSGLVRGNIGRAASLCWVTAQIASLGVCSVGLLEVIAGGFVALFCFRRRLMSLLSWIYAVQVGREQSDIITLPMGLVDELWSLVVLCPLAVTDLRASFSEELYMVDASNWGDAVVSACIKGSMHEEIHRHGVSKGCWTKLLSPFKGHLRGKGILPEADELPEGEVAYEEHPVWESAARCLDFSLVWKRRAKSQRHINVGEMRAYLKAEAVAGLRACDQRVPVGGDSQVVIGAVCKGRSASECLNEELRRSLPQLLGNGIYSTPGYVRSAHNPADDPTRGKSLRSPSCYLPQWWIDADLGDFSGIDEFLSSCDLLPEQLAGYDSLAKLNLKEPDLLDKSICSSRHRKQKISVKEKLRSRKASEVSNKVSPSDEPYPWSQEIYDIFLFFGKEQFVFGSDERFPPVQPGFIDLYSGKKGFARACSKLGATWILTVDILDGPQCDLLDGATRIRIEKLLKVGACLCFSAAPICASFSTAITPAVRSPLEPRGIQPIRPGMVKKIADGNSHSQWLALMIRLCISLRISYWVENPDGSYLWRQSEWLELPKGMSRKYFRVDFCTFGTAWRKRTRFLTSCRLRGTKRLCNRQHNHVILRGRSRQKKISMTKLAEPYPKGLCFMLAWAICADLNVLKSGASFSCRCDHRSIGEAKNPGPRQQKPATRDPRRLDQVEMVRPETVAIGSAAWDSFAEWIKESMGQSVLQSCWLVPSLMGSIMGHYGRHVYESGGALFRFRHLVVYAQRMHPGFRGHLQPAWNLINRWEELEPVVHRRPLPLRMVQAMISLALFWNWTRVACVIMIAFFGCCRPGEVLQAKRRHLVFPVDLAQTSGPMFLRISKPKPGRRGMGRVQHAKTSQESIVSFLETVFSGMHGNQPVYPGSAGAFRTRWNKLMTSLEVPLSTGLTPGGLRAGGTVNLYREGTPIMDILWALRLKNVETLQHYLQEISTQITMFDLSPAAKVSIGAFADFFHFALSIYKH